MSARHSRLSIDLTAAAHKRLKTAALMMGITMKDLVVISIEDFMHRKLNRLTAKTLKDADAGKGLKKFDTLDDLFEDLGI